MNEVTSRPRTLQPYVMEITEVKKKTSEKKILICQEIFREIADFTLKNRYLKQFQIRINNVGCVF
jgi:hypothetical protein